MKAAIYSMLSLLCMSCRGQNIQHKADNSKTEKVTPIDTVSILPLRNKHYSPFSYVILRLELSDFDKSGHSIKKIAVTQNNKTVASILLPNSEDVKNFSISEIAETERGFKIVVDWGGGNYFYGRKFYFTIKGNQFYLDSLEMNSYTQEREKETKTTKKINPPIPIGKFDIISYLDNE